MREPGATAPGSVAASFNLDQATEEGRSAADVGEPVGGQDVRAAAVFGHLVPADGGGADDSRGDYAVDFGGRYQGAAIVEGTDAVAVTDAAGVGVGLVHLDDGGLAVHVAAIAEGRVHAVVVLRRNHFERKTFLQGRIAEAGFDGRRVGQMLRAELAFSGGRAEAVRKREKWAAEVQADGVFAIEAFKCNAVEERMAGG